MNVRRSALLLVLLSLPLSRATAQEDPSRALATRSDLQAILSSGVNGTEKLTDRARRDIEQRLSKGDFQVGDRLIIRVVGDSTFRGDTLMVRSGPEVPLPSMPPLALAGVLRSELQEKARAHIANYIREPQVQATALVRFGVLGSVVRPGYYSVGPEKPLSEALMAAGGLSADADLKKVTISRDGSERFSTKQVRQAMAQGISLDQMGIEGGDELSIGRRGSGFGATVPIITGIASIGIAIVALIITQN